MLSLGLKSSICQVDLHAFYKEYFHCLIDFFMLVSYNQKDYFEDNNM